MVWVLAHDLASFSKGEGEPVLLSHELNKLIVEVCIAEYLRNPVLCCEFPGLHLILQHVFGKLQDLCWFFFYLKRNKPQLYKTKDCISKQIHVAGDVLLPLYEPPMYMYSHSATLLLDKHLKCSFFPFFHFQRFIFIFC